MTLTTDQYILFSMFQVSDQPLSASTLALILAPWKLQKVQSLLNDLVHDGYVKPQGINPVLYSIEPGVYQVIVKDGD